MTQFSPVLGVVCRKEVAVRNLSNAGAEYEVRWVRLCFYRLRSPGQIPPKRPDFLPSSGHLNRGPEALDAPPHPNGSGPLGPLGLPTKWDGLGGAGIGIYGLSRHPAGRGSGRGGIRGWDRAGGGAAGERPWAPKAQKNPTGWS